MTKPPAPSTDAALARLDFFGPPPLLEGEDHATYNELLIRISGAVKSVDVLEEILVRDIVTLTWEILRWHRLKANLIAANTYKAVEAVLEPMIGWAEAQSLAEDWARRDPDAVKKVKEELKSADLSMDAIVAQTYAAKLAEIERFDRMAMNAEARRNAALHEIDRRRASFGQALRRANEEAVDAQYKQIDAPQIANQSGA